MVSCQAHRPKLLRTGTFRNRLSLNLMQFTGSWGYLRRPYKTRMFWMSDPRMDSSASQEVPPTAGESPKNLPSRCLLDAGTRVPSPRDALKSVHGSLGRRLPWRLTVPGERYPYPVLVGCFLPVSWILESVAAELFPEGHLLNFSGCGVRDFIDELDTVGHPPVGYLAVQVGQHFFSADVRIGLPHYDE